MLKDLGISYMEVITCPCEVHAPMVHGCVEQQFILHGMGEPCAPTIHWTPGICIPMLETINEFFVSPRKSKWQSVERVEASDTERQER